MAERWERKDMFGNRLFICGVVGAVRKLGELVGVKSQRIGIMH